MKSYSEFKRNYLDKSVDIDNFPLEQKYQCADLGNTYIAYCGGQTLYATETGYVRDYAAMKDTNGLLNWFDEKGLHDIREGDLLIWDFSNTAPFSHIGVADGPITGGYVDVLGQNQPYPYVNITRLSCDGLMGVFRPKMFNKPLTQYDGNVEPINDLGLKYQAHTQNIGWREWAHDGMIAGSVGASKRLEALRIDTSAFGDKLKLRVKAHIENIGWVTYNEITPETIIGTVGKALRLEAIEIDPVVNDTEKTLRVQVHLANTGWTGTVNGGYTAGTVGISKAIEAIKLWLE